MRSYISLREAVVTVCLLKVVLLSGGQAFAMEEYCSGNHSQADFSKCVSEDLKYEDKKLNTSYSALRKMLNTKDKEQLKVAQLHWISFRDITCQFSSRYFYGRSAYQMEVNKCKLRHTELRRLELDTEIQSMN